METESVTKSDCIYKQKSGLAKNRAGSQDLLYRTLHHFHNGGSMDNYIGIDIAKATLQIFIPRGRLDLEFENSRTGLNQFYKQLKQIYQGEYQGLIFVYESTGSYSRPLEQFCQKKRDQLF